MSETQAHKERSSRSGKEHPPAKESFVQRWSLKLMRRLDWYVLGKFMSTFFSSIVLIIFIVIVFDISEKIEDFLHHDLSLETIVFDYYFNFVPYFVNLFSALFTFIAVIFFTSRMASRTEIVAILSTGISFRRFLVPYLVGATLIAGTSLYLSNWLIPRANKARLAFEAKYVGSGTHLHNTGRNIHREIDPGVMAYIQQYDVQDSTGYQFALEKFKGMDMYYKLTAEEILWSEARQQWLVLHYFARYFNGPTERWENGDSLWLKLNMVPKDFESAESVKESMTWGELNRYIEAEGQKGSDAVQKYQIEKHKRIVFPFATFILTLIGVSLSSRKVRGGIGLHLGLGIAIAFTYILFMQVFASFAEASVMPAYIALWVPNILFGLLAIYLLRKAPK